MNKKVYVKSGYHLVSWNSNHDNYKCIYSGDKVIVRSKNKTIQGEILSIGKKYIYILTEARFRCKRTLYQPNIRLEIEEIEKIRKFPDGSQKFKTIEANSNWIFNEWK